MKSRRHRPNEIIRLIIEFKFDKILEIWFLKEHFGFYSCLFIWFIFELSMGVWNLGWRNINVDILLNKD